MDGILKITDNGGETLDRYAVYFEDRYVLFMSPTPQSPRGVCMSDTWRRIDFDHDDNKQVRFDDLPERVQKAIRSFLVE